MKRSVDRILTTHVGSLPRPPALLAFLKTKRDKQSYHPAEHLKCLCGAVVEAVSKQALIGIDIVSDGEYGKYGFSTYAYERLAGFAPRESGSQGLRIGLRGGRDRSAFPELYEESDKLRRGAAEGSMACTGPIAYQGRALVQNDIDNFKAALQKVRVADAFIAAIAPGNFGRGENEYYPSEDAFVGAVAEAMRDEYKAIVDAGFLLQIDAPVGSYDTLSLSVEEFRRRFELNIEALNHALEGIPEDRIRLHICWGSWNAPHMFDIPLAAFLDIVFKARVQGIALEAANPRHEHEFQIWRETKLPDGKLLIPGLVSHATNVVEHPELVSWRIKNFVNLLGRENVIAGTDCGFSQGAFTAKVHPSVAWAKLGVLVEGARLASNEIWDR
jgi:5-methyltetrahydropteroyltriglutamate--homocysteine methyltransferase